MMLEKMTETARELKQQGIESFLQEHNITLKYSSTLKEQACICLCREQAILMIRNDLQEQEYTFTLLHELGHYVFDYECGEFTYTYRYRSDQSEFQANLFAGIFFLVGIDLMDLNIIDYLCRCGCPVSISYRIFDYLKQNLKVPYL